MYSLGGGWRAKEWKRMQRGAPRLWEESLRKLDDTRWRVWVHVSSVGEFELVVPLLRALRSASPHTAILVSYFSPSLHFHRDRVMVVADVAAPLLPDLPSNVSWLIERIKPSMVLFVKYDHWLGYLSELKRRGIPLFLLAAHLYNGHPFRRISWLGRYVLSRYSVVLAQDDHTAKVLRQWRIPVVRVGDPRADRMVSIAGSEWRSSLLEAFVGCDVCVVCGSTYSKEEEIVARFIRENSMQRVKWIVAPHELTADNIARVRRVFGEWGAVLSEASQLSAEQLADKRVLISDVAGILKYIYRYGRVALVGGGFGRGVHSVIEPAAYRLPVLAGPRIHRSYEARWLHERGGLFTFSDYEAFRDTLLRLLSSPQELARAGSSAYKYITANAGATRRTLSIILDFKREVVG